MSTLSIRVEYLPGTTVREAAVAMQALADRVGVDIQGRFNDVTLVAIPGGDADVLEREFHTNRARKLPVAIAFSAGRKLGRERDQ